MERKNELTPFVDGQLWTCHRRQRFFGIQMGTRMTVCRLSSGDLWIHSPVAPDDRLLASLGALGPVRHIVAPSKLHHLYVMDFARHFPDAAVHGSPGLPAKRPDIPFSSVLGDSPDPGWAADLDQCPVRGNRVLDEVVFLHRPSRTLIVADLCEEGNEEWPFFSRLASRVAGIYERHGPPIDMKLLFRHDRKGTRRTVERILSWDFDRMILSHGRLVQTGAREIFRQAYGFALAW
jgi:hypothetical protein